MPNVVNVFLTLIFGTLIKHLKLTEAEKRTFFLGIVWLLLTFVAGTRGLYALGDTEAYYSTYLEASRYSLSTYFQLLSTDYLFYLINWFFSNAGVPWQIFLLIHEGFVLGVFCNWIRKYSEDPILSMLVFECLFLNIWQLALRQALGMAFLLLAYDHMNKEGLAEKIRAVLLFIMGVMCHSTAILVLAYVVLRKIPIRPFTLLAYTIGTIVCYVFRSQFLVLVNLFANSMNRNVYKNFWSANPYTLILLCVVILLMFLYLHKPIVRAHPIAEEYYSAMFLMVAMLSLGGGVIVRLAWYFGVFVCLILPVIAEQFRPQWFTKTVMIGMLLLLYLNSVDTSMWYFFWQK